jgi:hypothetical protein
VRVVGASLDARALLAPVALAAAAAGAGSLAPIGAAVVGEGNQIGSFVEVRADDCLLALARAGPTMRDVDLFVFDDGGERLGSDESPEPHGAVLVCPPHPRRLYVAARVVSGTGIVALGVMPLAREAAAAVAVAVGARGGESGDSGQLAAWPGLETKIRERRRQLGSSWEDVRRLAMPLDPRAYAAVSVPLAAKRCVDVLVAPDDEVQGLDLLAVDEVGRVVARGRPPGRDRSLTLCSELKRSVTLMVRPRASGGLAAVVISRSPEGAAPEIAERTWIDAATPIVPLENAVVRHAEQMRAVGGETPRRLATVRLSAGAVVAVPVSLGGGCTRLDVVGASPLAAFTAELWTEGGRRLASARGGESAALFHCGGQVSARLELTAVEAGGPAAVLARHDARPPAALLQLGTAASRLLERLEGATGPVGAAIAAPATRVHLDDRSRHEVVLDVGARTCSDVVVALDEGAHGVALRLMDQATGSELGARGRHVASERICADDTGRRVRLELGVAAGAATALLLVRTLPAVFPMLP